MSPRTCPQLPAAAAAAKQERDDLAQVVKEQKEEVSWLSEQLSQCVLSLSLSQQESLPAAAEAEGEEHRAEAASLRVHLTALDRDSQARDGVVGQLRGELAWARQRITTQSDTLSKFRQRLTQLRDDYRAARVLAEEHREGSEEHKRRMREMREEVGKRERRTQRSDCCSSRRE